MIDITFPSLRKPKPTYFPVKPVTNDEQGKIWMQTNARDKIIRELAAKCNYVVGEIVTPYCQEQREKMGERCVVEGICDTYVKYGKKAAWPATNQPLIVTARSVKTDSLFFCSPGFLLPLNQDGTIPQDK